MSTEELVQGGIIVDGNISDEEFALILLKYNKIYNDQDKEVFNNLAQKVIDKFEEFDINNLDESRDKEFVKYSLAVCDKDIQKTYLKGKNNIDRILAIHKMVVLKKAEDFSGKENIRTARSVADGADSLRIRQQKYIESKDQYQYLFSCIKNEDVFNVFFQRLQGRLSKDMAKNMLLSKFSDIREKFRIGQDKYLEFFIKHQVIEDARINYSKVGDIV